MDLADINVCIYQQKHKFFLSAQKQ